ncbi:hypothetical protein SAMN05444515_104110 [Ectothiorhodospira marina]|uniref:Uncharacterized protein n=1 Tax=Ectothiorhodospira marina TaxID=1396821 RepID=A0A1H7J7B4_9GAMM|nr:hypothetical protein SAMN05444515_104110 [Ectothiorhodospira marina]
MNTRHALTALALTTCLATPLSAQEQAAPPPRPCWTIRPGSLGN